MTVQLAGRPEDVDGSLDVVDRDDVAGILAEVALRRVDPEAEGSVLDLIIDYLNYVFIPSVLIWRAGSLPTEIGFLSAAAINSTSLPSSLESVSLGSGMAACVAAACPESAS